VPENRSVEDLTSSLGTIAFNGLAAWAQSDVVLQSLVLFTFSVWGESFSSASIRTCQIVFGLQWSQGILDTNELGTMHLDQFDIHSATFEVRYNHNLFLWDRSGRYWSTWRAKFPDLKFGATTPNEIQAGTSTFAAIVGIERALVTSNWPSNKLSELTEPASHMVQALSEVLEVGVFTRLGFRTIFRRRFKSMAEASQAIFELGILKAPPNGKFGIQDGVPLYPEYASRLEGSDFGVTVRLKAQELSVTTNTMGVLENDQKSETNLFFEVIYDCDYYTVKQVLTAQLRAKDWLEAAFHSVRRDSHAILGEQNADS